MNTPLSFEQLLTTHPEQFLKSLEATLPHWTQIEATVSVQSRPIALYTQQALPPQSPLDTLIFAAIHGDEPESVSLLLNWAQQYHNSQHAVGIIPVLNPDGLVAKTRKNANHIDINRNFPTQNWGETSEPNAEHLRQAIIQNDPTAHYYAGSVAASEPETQFLMQVLASHPPRKIISLHTPYRVINYDGPALDLANAMATHNGYDVVADIGYPTPGSFGNYAGIERNSPVITLELPENDAFTPAELSNNIAALNAVVNF